MKKLLLVTSIILNSIILKAESLSERSLGCSAILDVIQESKPALETIMHSTNISDADLKLMYQKTKIGLEKQKIDLLMKKSVIEKNKSPESFNESIKISAETKQRFIALILKGDLEEIKDTIDSFSTEPIQDDRLEKLNDAIKEIGEKIANFPSEQVYIVTMRKNLKETIEETKKDIKKLEAAYAYCINFKVQPSAKPKAELRAPMLVNRSK